MQEPSALITPDSSKSVVTTDTISTLLMSFRTSEQEFFQQIKRSIDADANKSISTVEIDTIFAEIFKNYKAHSRALLEEIIHQSGHEIPDYVYSSDFPGTVELIYSYQNH